MLLNNAKNSLECCLLTNIRLSNKYKNKMVDNVLLDNTVSELEYLYSLLPYITTSTVSDFINKVQSLCTCCTTLFNTIIPEIELENSNNGGLDTIYETEWIPFEKVCLTI